MPRAAAAEAPEHPAAADRVARADGAGPAPHRRLRPAPRGRRRARAPRRRQPGAQSDGQPGAALGPPHGPDRLADRPRGPRAARRLPPAQLVTRVDTAHTPVTDARWA